jgi:hypothetical protein
MLWIITADHINERVCKALDEPVKLMVGKTVTHSAKRNTEWRNSDESRRAELRAAWLEECTEEFRLLDDDGECYYEGMCKDLDGQPEEAAFEPLDWARRNDGCTSMQYRRKGAAVWRTL